tara:strand:- start:1277 stop:1564 length:288 start_codon:yes stop_codon:yes gene_type:complete
MIEIPDDIAATAEALVDELHANPDVTFAGILAGPTFERRIAETLAAERKRCAAVCDQWLAMYGKRGDELKHTTPQEWANSAVTDIAAAIVKGGAP